MQLNLPQYIGKKEKNSTKYKIYHQLGRGGFASCHLVMNIQSGQKYAVKVCPKKKERNKKSAELRLRSEIQILRRLNHSNITKYEDHFEDSENVYLLMEYCQKITLQEMLKNRKKLTEIQIRYFLYQLISGLIYLRSQSIIHRDIKICNIMLTGKLVAKIGDFGLATYHNEKNAKEKRTVCGTPNYMAPQIINKNFYSFEVDIWSTGILIYNLLFSKCPFTGQNQKQTYSNITSLRYTFPEQVSTSKEIIDLINRMLCLDIEKRITLKDILSHPFMKEAIPRFLPESNYKKCPANVEVYKLEKGSKSLSNTKAVNEHIPKKVEEIEQKSSKIEKIDEKQEPKQNIDLSNFIYIKHFLDRTSKYGLCYQLTNGNCGIFFNDHSSIFLKLFTGFVFYNNTEKNLIKFHESKLPQSKKILDKYFILRQYIRKVKIKKPEKQIEISPENELKIIRSWSKYKGTFLFQLKGVIQIIYGEDSQILILKEERKIVLMEDEALRVFDYPVKKEKMQPKLEKKFNMVEYFLKLLIKSRN